MSGLLSKTLFGKPMKKYLEIYTDGGWYEQKNRITWGFIIVDNDVIQYTENSHGSGAHKADVERAESEAIIQACKYVAKNPGNYRLYTDSKSVINKIENKVPNATKNPNIKGIQKILNSVNSSWNPESLVIEYKRRRSDIFSEHIDDLCRAWSGVNFK